MMMNKELNVKEGDKIIIVKPSYTSCTKSVSTITRITPTGRIKVKGWNEYQFDKYGRAMGNHDVWYSSPHLEMYDEEVEREIKEKAYIENCTDYMRTYTMTGGRVLTYEQAKKIMKILKETERVKSEN